MTSVIQGQGKETRDREKYRLLDFVLTSATFVYDPFASASPTLAQVFTLRESSFGGSTKGPMFDEWGAPLLLATSPHTLF